MEAILRESGGIHTRSDFATRDRCRRVVEESARLGLPSEAWRASWWSWRGARAVAISNA
jgi:hypothetical protein